MGGVVYEIWQVISMEKTRKRFRFVLDIKLLGELGKCVKAELISLSL